MTQPPLYVPGPEQQPPAGWPAQPEPSSPKPRRPLLWILGAVGVLVLVGLAGGIGYAARSGGSAPATAAATTTAVQAVDNPTPEPEDTTPRVTYTPTTDDFELTAKITEKHCFGSAGCNVTFRPDLTYSGTTALDQGVTWLLVYEINGVEDAPQVGNLTIEGLTVSYNDEVVSTKSNKSKITIKVTSVEEQD